MNTQNSLTKNVVALGKFDGVHIGHQLLIETAAAIACENNMQAIVCTILPCTSSKNITTEEIKEQIICSLGADLVIRQYLNEDFKNLTPEAFVKNILLDKLNAGHVVVGYNFKFGKNRSGNAEFLEELCRTFNIGITVIESVSVDNEEGISEPVSSTRIRSLIENGKIEETQKCLGRNFRMSGTVTEGKHLGRILGFPTVNFYPDENELVPKHGVYAVKACVENEKFWGITNVGINPTVENGKNIKVETFLFNFDGREIYGLPIEIEFIGFLRCEKKFSDVEELKKQISQDKEYVSKKYL